MDYRQIPYGIGDFERVRMENYFYLDKTRFIPALERTANFNFLVRPRRFGKSLFCGMLHCYYDLAHKDRFDELFQGTWIHANPTPERGKYLILSLNFSAVDPDARKVEESFHEHVRLKIESMVKTRYASLFPEAAALSILAHRDVTSLTAALFEFCRNHGLPLYLIIDEYDNFANSILAAEGEDAYRELTHRAGFFKHFFALFKAGATGPGAAVKRMFMTGVSPVTMDDVTSGYNIGANVSLRPAFNEAMGFTSADVDAALAEYVGPMGLTTPAPELKELLQE